MHHGCDDRSHSSTDADDGWMDRKQSAGKITQRDRDRERRPQSRPGPRRSTAGRTREGRSGAEAAARRRETPTRQMFRAEQTASGVASINCRAGVRKEDRERVNDGAQAGGRRDDGIEWYFRNK